MARKKVCSCSSCAALLSECGSELFPLYSKKLLERGWAGIYTPAETDFRRKHTV